MNIVGIQSIRWRLRSWPQFEWSCWMVVTAAALSWTVPAAAQTNPPPTRPISLVQCIQEALLRNRALQIERINPEIARAALSSAYGVYDPLLVVDVQRQNLTDSGGFDPADFNQDTTYSAKSVVVRSDITGVLPTGLTYSMGGDYANSYGVRNLEEFNSFKTVGGILVQQPLLKNFWIDAGRTLIRINKHNLKITELGVSYLAMDVINQLQQAYYELLFAREIVGFQEQLLASRQTTLAGTQRKVEQGVLTVPDLQLAQSQAAIVEINLIGARNDARLAGNLVRTLIGDDFSSPIEPELVPTDYLIMIPELLDLLASRQNGLTHRPDLSQLRHDIEKARIDQKYRRNQLFPGLDLVAGYGRKGASTDQGFPATANSGDAFSEFRRGTSPNATIGAIFSLPLSRTAERANYRMSKHLKAQADLLLKQREELVLREVSDAFHTAGNSRERVESARRAYEQAQQVLASEERKLAGGKSDLFFVLQYQNDVFAAQTAEARARADYNQALSQLRFAEGTLLEANRIVLDFD